MFYWRYIDDLWLKCKVQLLAIVWYTSQYCNIKCCTDDVRNFHKTSIDLTEKSKILRKMSSASMLALYIDIFTRTTSHP